jgi:DNA-binding transcriptional LysR family regulator
VELRHLRYFLAVAQELHFSRAAELLHISQPPLSRQIQDLERELGITLFRRNRRVELTDAGARLLDSAQRVMDALDDFTAAAEVVSSGGRRRLRLGWPAAAAAPVVADAVRRYESSYPDVDLQLAVDGSGRLLRSVRADLLDAAFVQSTSDRSDGLAHHTVARDPLVVLVPGDHPCAARSLLGQDDLAGARLILPDPELEPDLHALLTADVLGDVTPEPTTVLETSSLESVYSAVLAGFGTAIVTRSNAALATDARIACVPLDPAAPAVELMLVWDPDAVVPPLATFIDELRRPDLPTTGLPATDHTGAAPPLRADGGHVVRRSAREDRTATVAHTTAARVEEPRPAPSPIAP